MRLTALSLLVLCASALPMPVFASGEFEFGVDAGFTLSFIDDVDENQVAVGLPAADFGALLQNLRVGYVVDSMFEMESSVGFSYLSQGSDSFWRLGWGLYGLVHPAAAGRRAAASGVYLRAGAQMDVVGGDNESQTQMGAAAGIGAKLALGDRWALRPEAGVVRRFETDERHGSWDVTGRLGFSFFTEAPAGARP